MRLKRLIPLLPMLIAAAPASAQQADDWQFSLTPYVWAAVIKGNTAAGDAEPPPINPDYNFLSLSNLQGFAFLAFTARKNKWSFNTDIVYINFSDNFDLGPLNTNLQLKGGALDLVAGYSAERWANTELLFGTRGVRLDADIVLTPGPDGNAAKTWWDPIVGFRHHRMFGERWGMLLRGDVGGFGVSSEFTANAVVGGTFRFNDLFSMMLGYRYLKLNFTQDDYLMDLEVQGYALGFSFSW